MNLLANASHSNYTPEILFCGGSTIDDTLTPDQMSSQTPASDQCSRLKLTTAGIAAGWRTDTMPGPRLMIDSILTPDGNVLLINGAATGVSTLSTFRIRYSPLITLLHISWQRLMLFPIRSAHRMPTTQVKLVRTFVDIP
jgi:hypothetical protein